MRGFGKVVLLFLVGLVVFLGSFVPLAHRIRWWHDGRDAVMTLEDPAFPPRGLVPGGYDIHFVNVKYEGADGVVHVPQKGLTLAQAQQLAAGGRIPVRYLRSNPDTTLINGEELENPYGYMILGLALMATGAFGYRLYRREQAAGGR